MIRATFAIVKETPREGERYPDKTTLVEFDLEVEVGEGIRTFQEALNRLTEPRATLVHGPISEDDAEAKG